MAYTMTATAMKTWKTNGILLRNHQIHDIVGQISPSYLVVMVCGRHWRTPNRLADILAYGSWSIHKLD